MPDAEAPAAPAATDDESTISASTTSVASNGQPSKTPMDLSTATSAVMSVVPEPITGFGSEVVTATEEGLKALGRLSLATLGLFTSAMNGVSQTTASAGNVVAQGVQIVNKVTGQVPVLGTVTTGAQNVITGTANTFSTNANFNSVRRGQFISDLRAQLNGVPQGTNSVVAAVGSTSGDDK